MPWFLATCEDQACGFRNNFEAEDKHEAVAIASVNHSAYACLSDETVAPSNDRVTFYSDPHDD